MQNLEKSSETQLKAIPKWWLRTFIAIAYIGFLDAAYLTAEHYSGAGLNCIIFKGCDQVANSVYSELFGFPVALYGTIFYFGMLFLSFLYIDLHKWYEAPNSTKFYRIFPFLKMKWAPLYTLVAFVMTLRFVYLQIFVIKAICTYCMVSSITSTLLFILGIILFRKRKDYL